MRNFKIGLLILLMVMFSCKAKKKVTERETKEIATIEVVDKTETTTVVEKSDSLVTSKTETIKVISIEDLDLKQSDPNKTITIEDETGKKLIIKGADVKIHTSKSNEVVVDTTSISVKKDSALESLKTDNTKTTKTEKTKKRTSTVDIKTFLGGWWIWVLVAIIVLIIWYVLKRYRIL